jgi:hypothetical protein
LNPKWLRIARIAGTLIFVLAVGSFTIASGHEVGLHFGGSRFVSVANATLQAGRNENRLTNNGTELARGFYFQPAWNPDWATAWRPFHARGMPWGGGTRWHMLVVPLWPLMPIGAAIAAYAHGVLMGMRRAKTTECQVCGYDLRKTPVVDGRRKCPECGVVTALSTAGVTPAPPDTA